MNVQDSSYIWRPPQGDETVEDRSLNGLKNIDHLTQTEHVQINFGGLSRSMF